MTLRLKKDDLVVVIAGKNKGDKGRVLKVLREKDSVIVEKINIIKRHQKPTPKQREGGIIEKEAPIHVSKVMLVDGKSDKPTRTKIGRDKDDKKVRIAVKTGTVLDG